MCAEDSTHADQLTLYLSVGRHHTLLVLKSSPFRLQSFGMSIEIGNREILQNSNGKNIPLFLPSKVSTKSRCDMQPHTLLNLEEGIQQT